MSESKQDEKPNETPSETPNETPSETPNETPSETPNENQSRGVDRGVSRNNDTITVALLIGINYIGTSSALNGCINDCENLKVLLEAHNYIGDDSIVIMMRDDRRGRLYPSKKKIQRQLRRLVRISRRNRGKKINMIVSYSGHGTQIRDRNRDEEDGMDEVIVPADYGRRGVITDDYIKRFFINRLHRNVNLVMLMDCCNSGTVVDLRYNYMVGGNSELEVNKKNSRTRARVAMISGARDDQFAMDAWLKDENQNRYESQGAMTGAFIANYTHGISYEELIIKMRDWLANYRFTQIPQLSTSKPIDIKSEFALAKFEQESE